MYRYNIYIYTYIIVYILYRTEYTGKMGQAGISTQSFSVLYNEGIVGINEISGVDGIWPWECPLERHQL